MTAKRLTSFLVLVACVYLTSAFFLSTFSSKGKCHQADVRCKERAEACVQKCERAAVPLLAKCTVAAAFTSHVAFAATVTTVISPLPGLMLAAALSAVSPVCEGVNPCASFCGGPGRGHADVLRAVVRVNEAVQRAEDLLANVTVEDDGHWPDLEQNAADFPLVANYRR